MAESLNKLRFYLIEIMNNQKYIIRRNLDTYSEEKFAKELIDRGFIPYYPFKDVGIDILATKKNKIFRYQLKARSLNSYNEYWFMVNEKRLNRNLKQQNMFYVFCALLSNNQFDFFVIPVKIIKRWYDKKREGMKTEKQKKREDVFLDIKPIGKSKYEIRPKRIKINIDKYKL